MPVFMGYISVILLYKRLLWYRIAFGANQNTLKVNQPLFLGLFM